jgi:hypothetical protein
MTVDVLGTEYSITETTATDDTYLNDMDGYCDHTTKSIVIDTFKPLPNSVKNLDEYKKQVIRHELVHAFLFESGLGGNSWANNEEIVDWIASMFPKMLKAFKETDSL